jgi:hypothetical protein
MIRLPTLPADDPDAFQHQPSARETDELYRPALSLAPHVTQTSSLVTSRFDHDAHEHAWRHWMMASAQPRATGSAS